MCESRATVLGSLGGHEEDFMKEINNSLTNSLRLGPWRSARATPRIGRLRIQIPLKKGSMTLRTHKKGFSEEVFGGPNGTRAEDGPQRRRSAAPRGNENNSRKISPEPRDGIERQSRTLI